MIQEHGLFKIFIFYFFNTHLRTSLFRTTTFLGYGTRLQSIEPHCQCQKHSLYSNTKSVPFKIPVNTSSLLKSKSLSNLPTNLHWGTVHAFWFCSFLAPLKRDWGQRATLRKIESSYRPSDSFQCYWKLTLTLPWPLSLSRFIKLSFCAIGRQFF